VPDQAMPLRSPSGVRLDGIGGLLHGQRFAGQRRFLDPQVAYLQQAQIGRHLVARGQQHDIAGHQFAGIDLHPLAVAQDRGAGRQQLANAVERRRRLAFLDETDHRVDQHGGEDHRGIDPVAEQGGDHRGERHDVEQDVVKLPQEAYQRPARLDAGQLVGAVALQSPGGFVAGEPFRLAIEMCKALFGAKGVPEGFVLGFHRQDSGLEMNDPT